MTILELLRNDPFVIGVASGIATFAILQILGKAGKAIMSFISENSGLKDVKKTKITNVYDNQIAGLTQILDDAKCAKKKMHILTNYPTVFTSLPINKELYEFSRNTNGLDKTFILLNPDSDAAKKRCKELDNIGMGNFIDELEIEIKKLHKDFSNINCKLTDTPIRFSFYIFDEVMYLGFNLPRAYAQNVEMYRITKESLLYEVAEAQFNDILEKSMDLKKHKLITSHDLQKNIYHA